MKRLQILITGSQGLIGAALGKALVLAGHRVVGLDLRATGVENGDVRDLARVHRALQGCDGVVHLAGVSRVIEGERDPQLCWDTNVLGLANVMGAIDQRTVRPWLVFASSREVYGDALRLPVTENAPLRPVNVYARSKVECESMVARAADRGLRTSIVRLSNVYGRIDDHPDRVIPAFARAAVLGTPMRVEGGQNTFDFTHVDDLVPGIISIILRLAPDHAVTLPPIQFVTGQALTLAQVAAMANELGGGRSRIVDAPPRCFDVAKFYGSWSRAQALLGWAPRITVAVGLTRLMGEIRADAFALPPRAAVLDSRRLPAVTPV